MSILIVPSRPKQLSVLAKPNVQWSASIYEINLKDKELKLLTDYIGGGSQLSAKLVS